MDKYTAEYKAKLMTLEEAAALIQPGDYLSVPPATGEPEALCAKIAERVRRGELEGITAENIWTYGDGNELWQSDLHGKVAIRSTFVNNVMRWAFDEGKADLIPSFYQDVPRLYERGIRKVDVFMAEVAPMDQYGFFNLSIALSNSQTCIRHARKVIFVVNDQMPRVGGDTMVPISSVDHIVEHHRKPNELHFSGTTPEAEKMAEYIVEMIPDGACIQVGVGNVPNAVTSLLTSKKDLGIHTELFCESMVDLVECGAVNNSRKTTNPGKSVFTFALGTERMYRYMDGNPSVESYQVNYTNDPAIIAKNKNTIAINATIQVDLTGQCCSESLGSRQYSGVGGQADFCRGAYLSEGGKSILCVNSTAKGGTLSTIVPWLNQGAIVSTPRTNIMYIVTEYGVATMIGKSTRERAQELIGIAHPRFRDELRFKAKEMHLL